MKNMIVQVGPYPDPKGGVSLYIKRMKEYLDEKEIENQVWDISNIKKNVKEVINIRFRYIPFLILMRGNIDIIHYNICGIKYKIYIGIFNKLFFKKIKKILTIHGGSKDLFDKNLNIMVRALNSFDTIICVKSGDREYLIKKGIKRPIYEIPAFIFPKEDKKLISQYILDFINSNKFIISANASYIEFYNNQDLYGIDMCIDLIERLNKNEEKVGLIFSLPNINNIKYFNKLINKIVDKKIESRFLFITESRELFPIIKRSNLFIRPTNTDGDAVSIREAQYAKVPTLASDVVKRPQGTILFKTRDIEDLYIKTKEVICNYTYYKEKIKNILFEDNGKKILEIYKGVNKI